MKKFALITAYFFFVCFLAGLTGFSADECANLVNTEVLNTECDFINAFDAVLDKIFSVIDGSDPSELSDIQEERIMACMDVLMELGDMAEEKLGSDDEEAKKCENYYTVEAKIEKFTPYILHLMEKYENRQR